MTRTFTDNVRHIGTVYGKLIWVARVHTNISIWVTILNHNRVVTQSYVEYYRCPVNTCFMLCYLILLQHYIGRQILNCLTLILTRYLHLLPVLLKTMANHNYDQSIAQLLIEGTFHTPYHTWHWLCITCKYTIHFNRRPFTQAVEDEDQDVSVLSDGPTEIITCIK